MENIKVLVFLILICFSLVITPFLIFLYSISVKKTNSSTHFNMLKSDFSSLLFFFISWKITNGKC